MADNNPVDENLLADADFTVEVKKEKLEAWEETAASCNDDGTLCHTDPACRSSVISYEHLVNGNGDSLENAQPSDPDNASFPPEGEEDPQPPIDYESICGSFGWTTVGDAYLPTLIRAGEEFVAVRMVESKIISAYVNVLPWTVFACTNVRSYYVTVNEARLLNEINSFHCEYYYGYHVFSEQDVVISLEDTEKFYEFLESCRSRLEPESANPLFKEKCGFIMVNGLTTPYVCKGSKKFVLYNMVYQEDISPPSSSADSVSDWDLAYFRFLSLVVAIDQSYLKVGATLCPVDDLQQIDDAGKPEEWWPAMRFSSRKSLLSSSDSVSPLFRDPLQYEQSKDGKEYCSESFRDIKDLEHFDKPMDLDWPPFKDSSTVNYEGSQTMQSIGNDSRAHLFPSSLESLLSSSSSKPKNFPFQLDGEIPSSISSDMFEASYSESGLSALATSRPTPFPPPPPLVRLQQSSQPDVPRGHYSKIDEDHYRSAYTCFQQEAIGLGHPSWTPPNWAQKENKESDKIESVPNSQSQMQNYAMWTFDPINYHVATTGSSDYNVSNNERNVRESYDAGRFAFYQNERYLSYYRESPRSLTSTGPPPYYPTPPQSSPMPHLDFHPLSALTELYSTFTNTRSNMVELCSPPPSPDIRSAISASPRGSNNDLPHSIRLAEVDSRYVLATNIEPFDFQSELAVPISEVVCKFLRGTSMDSCQEALESHFGFKLFECTRSQREAYAQHYVPLEIGSKLVAVKDLRSSLNQLRSLLKDQKKETDQSLNHLGANEDSEESLFKSWCEKETM